MRARGYATQPEQGGVYLLGRAVLEAAFTFHDQPLEVAGGGASERMGGRRRRERGRAAMCGRMRSVGLRCDVPRVAMSVTGLRPRMERIGVETVGEELVELMEAFEFSAPEA